MKSLYFLFLAIMLLCPSFQRQNKNLQKMNISNDITVSGISAGAFFAIQMGVIYSSIIKGVGSFAGGPYYCAQGLELDAYLYYCKYDTIPFNISILESYASQQASSGGIDPTSNLESQNVWIFSGTLDTVVNQKSSEYAAQFYQSFGASPVSVLNIPAEHSWVTNDFGNSCDTLGSPYINDCPQLDAVNQMLTQVYSGIKTLASPISQVDNNLFTFDQSSYGSSLISFADQGYIYIPTACQSGKQCALHIAFHGCEMQSNKIGTTFVIHSQLNGYAEANNIIILYPQLIASYFGPSNPEGCFDWWGYTNDQFATNQGPQPSAIRSMIKTLAGF